MPWIDRFAFCMLVLTATSARAQGFSSIEVKPAHSSDVQSRRVRVLSNGDLIATSVNAITLVDEGYAVPANPSQRLSALPAWVYSQRFDITAKATASRSKTSVPPNWANAFRLVLAERFQLKMRSVNRRGLVYALVVTKSEPKLKPTNPVGCVFDDAPDGCHSFVIGFGHPLNARAVNMDDLAHYLENWTDLPVVNRTGLAGLFKMDTEGWQPMRLPPPPPNGTGTVDFTHLPTLDVVLRHLGLALRKQTAVVPTYTVEHIEPPSTD